MNREVGSPSVDELRAMSPRELRQVLANGHPVNPAALDNTQYRGVSLGLPRWVEKLSWTTFMKTFYRDSVSGALRGWNIRLAQTGLHGAVEPILNGSGDPRSFGHFHVVAADTQCIPPGCSGGLLIDYGLGGNHPLDIIGRVRDPLVALSPSSHHRLLGASYLDLGFKIMTPSFFLLELHGPLEHVVSPPSQPAPQSVRAPG